MAKWCDSERVGTWDMQNTVDGRMLMQYKVGDFNVNLEYELWILVYVHAEKINGVNSTLWYILHEVYVYDRCVY